MTDWPGLTEDECREIVHELFAFVARGGHGTGEYLTDPDALVAARDDFVNVRLRLRGCPEDQLAYWRERIRKWP